MSTQIGSAEERRLRRSRVIAEARKTGGVLSRRLLLELGITRWEIRAELSAGRCGRWPEGCRRGRRPRGGAEVGQPPSMLGRRRARDPGAALYVLASGQQRLFTPEELAEEVVKIRRDKRRRLLRGLAADLAGGIGSVCERDFALMCRGRGYPEPTRQTIRYTESGRLVYDNDFDPYDVTAEIDGSQHLDPASWMSDAFKQNVVSLEGRTVIRIPNLALRLDADPFFDQLGQALRRGGWTGPTSGRRPMRRAS